MLTGLYALVGGVDGAVCSCSGVDGAVCCCEDVVEAVCYCGGVDGLCAVVVGGVDEVVSY